MELINAIISDNTYKLNILSNQYNFNQEINGSYPLIMAIIYNSEKAVSFLLSHGANPNIITKDDKTPLMFANNLVIVITLLEYGAEVNAQDINGNTALLFRDGNYTIIETLLKYGADINHINYDGQTALTKNINNRYITLLLLNNPNLDLSIFNQGRLALIKSDNKEELLKQYHHLGYKIPNFVSHIAEYSYLKTLGSGFMGVVILALRKSDYQLVAIKIIAGIYNNPDYEINDAELKIVEYLMSFTQRQSSLVKYYESYVDYYGKNVPHFNYIIMEYIDGLSLNKLYQHFEISKSQKISWLVQLLQGLEFLSEHLILDFDLNISNILIRNSDLKLKIIDLGLACFKDQHQPTCQEYHQFGNIYITTMTTINLLLNSETLSELIIPLIEDDIKHYDYTSAKIKILNID